LSAELIVEATLRSLAVSGVAAALAGAGGLVLAWLISRTDLPMRETVGGLLSLPYALPPYLLGMAWVVLGNPKVGILRAWLPAGGSYGFWGMTLVLGSVAFAFPFLEVRSGFDRLDPSLEEAARISGASPWRTLRDESFRSCCPRC
jgi:iron(III) transport system permease protein